MCQDLIWDESRVLSYISNAIEENSRLEYKGAGALQKTDGKKREITKDISAMANGSGGVLIYGIDEYSNPSREHLPEKISPINRCDISREWLDQVISTIDPPIKDYIIHPVDIGSDPKDVVYVVEIPQSTTAHQARDGRYYRRRNTTTVVLDHYEVVDIMNRGILPDVNVEFSWEYTLARTADLHVYDLIIKIINFGLLVEHYQLDFLFTYCIDFSYNGKAADAKSDTDLGYLYSQRVIINSENVLFPNQIVDFSKLHKIRYSVNKDVLQFYYDSSSIIFWTIYADQMQPKTGVVEFKNLNNF